MSIKKILRQTEFTFLMLVGALGVQGEAFATAFLTNPIAGIPFRPPLWNIPTVAGTRTLDYAFAPANAIPGLGNVAFLPAQQGLINAASATWNARAPANGNIVAQPLFGLFDLQSTALHEFGHALGLGDSNLAGVVNFSINDPGLDGTPGTADDFDNPFRAFAIMDGFTLQPSAVIADRATAAGAPYNLANTEAVMVQGARPNEFQRALGFDDAHGLGALNSGPDFTQGTVDDFTYVLNQVAFAAPAPGGNPGQQITLYNTNLGGRGGAALPLINWAFPFTLVLLDFDYITGNVISETDVFFQSRQANTGEQGMDLSTGSVISLSPSDAVYEVVHTDIFFDPRFFVPEPGSFVLLCAGLIALGFRKKVVETLPN